MQARRQFLRLSATALFGLWATRGHLLAQTTAPGETVYVVKRGDTLTAIASRHGTTLASLRSRNRITGDRILVGQRLVIPATSSPPAAGNRAAILAPVLAATAPLRISRTRWRHLVTHHSGIESGNAAAYDAAHRRRGMEHGLAYHFVIGNGLNSPEGVIEVGDRWRRQLRGGHVRNQAVNNTGIGICLVGNFQNRAPSAAQLLSFTTLLDYLRREIVSSDCEFTVHRWVDRNHTVCPGRFFPYDDMKRRYG